MFFAKTILYETNFDSNTQGYIGNVLAMKGQYSCQ